MKSIIAFVLGATLIGVSSGVIADSRSYNVATNVATFNEENGLWGNPCPVVYGLNKPCDQEVLTFMQENMLYN